MWIPGIALGLIFSSLAVIPLISRTRLQGQVPKLWNLGAVAIGLTELSGSLAALSLAAAVFIATLTADSGVFEDSIGLFVLSFLILTGAAMQFASTPNRQENESEEFHSIQNVSYVIAISTFFLGIALSWIGLRLLLLAIRADTAADILTWILLLSIIAGALRVCTHLYRHTEAAPSICFAIFAIGFLGPIAYKAGPVGVWSDLWPQRNETLYLATIAFVIAVVGHSFQTAILAVHGHERLEPVITRFHQPFLALYALNVIEIVLLVWLAVAEH